jgi:hypothetical protein
MVIGSTERMSSFGGEVGGGGGWYGLIIIVLSLRPRVCT